MKPSATKTGMSVEPVCAIPLKYREDPTHVYARLLPFGDATLFDSGPLQERGRWDIVAAQADPSRELRLAPDASSSALSNALEEWSTQAEALCHHPPETVSPGELPFRGGYLGHLSYELGRRLMGFSAASGLSLPLAVVRYYPWAVVQDRLKKTATLVSDGSVSEAKLLRIREQLDEAHSDSSRVRESALSPLEPQAGMKKAWSVEQYSEVFSRVKNYIQAGDCYQINIGQPFISATDQDFLSTYRALREVAEAPYSALLHLDETHRLLCFSPERFLSVDGRTVLTSPIKGTRPRSKDPLQDQALADELMHSEKERAENLMIVDLLRNDIGRYCAPGSVKANALFELESYRTVHHLVSTISGELRSDVSALRLLLGCMPGGSITGTPKHRAMQIIDDLEAAPRQSWCGTVFYWSRHGRLDSNIAIRSLFNTGDAGTEDEWVCWAGGGLVDDSELEAEYAEQEHKVGALLRALAPGT